VAHTNEITFLGFSFTSAKIFWSSKVLVCFKQRIKELYRPIPEIDHWLRGRMRMCDWKQWRYCRPKVYELTKLGTFLHTAISVGLSRKSSWRLSRTLATHSGMTNQWLKDQGSLAIKDLWGNTHYPATRLAIFF